MLWLTLYPLDVGGLFDNLKSRFRWLTPAQPGPAMAVDSHDAWGKRV